MKKENQIEMCRVLTTLGLILALLLGFSLGADAQNAATLLDKAAAQYIQSNGLKAVMQTGRESAQLFSTDSLPQGTGGVPSPYLS